ncbi:hypothetical protein BGZ80_000252 [Entomortierella chlamydospora]|uniref:Uncharacterized protein n=1 Tax=Entomortierella chlamydospora TaxID=101097 RepID=A0A9P6MSM3_9FUNG|nr:hypothetical protein BGZ80_000252 [Entomortierella chlamydospora]
MSFELKIVCNCREPQDFIFANPQSIDPYGQLFSNMYPIAWRVARFAGVSSRSTGGNGPITFTLTQGRTVGISERRTDNVVESSNHVEAGDKQNNSFVTVKSEGAYKLELNPADPNVDFTARVDNKQNQMLKPDLEGNWMTFSVSSTREYENKLWVEYTNECQYVNCGGSKAPFNQFGREYPVFKTRNVTDELKETETEP